MEIVNPYIESRKRLQKKNKTKVREGILSTKNE